MKRNGKIAHLPEMIREQLNLRLMSEHSERSLAEWLNNLPEVQAVLAKHFGGRPLSQQNISEWKLGGYRQWLEKRENTPGLMQSDPELRKHFRSALITCFEEALEGYMRKTVEDALEQLTLNRLATTLQQEQGNSSNN